MESKKIIIGSLAAIGAAGLAFLIGKPKQTSAEGYPCPYCAAIFDTQAELDDHIALVHSTGGETVFTCPYCYIEFASEEELAEHIALEHQTPTNTYDCSFCDRTFDSPEELAEHVALEHSQVSPAIYENISSTTNNQAYVDKKVLVKVAVANPNNTPVTETVNLTIEPASYQIESENPMTMLIPANSTKTFGFNVRFNQPENYIVSAGDLEYSLSIVESSTPPNLGGYFCVGSGVIECRWPDGTVQSTAYISMDEVYIVGGAFGQDQHFRREDDNGYWYAYYVNDYNSKAPGCIPQSILDSI